jgi:hypothetical protein
VPEASGDPGDIEATLVIQDMSLGNSVCLVVEATGVDQVTCEEEACLPGVWPRWMDGGVVAELEDLAKTSVRCGEARLSHLQRGPGEAERGWGTQAVILEAEGAVLSDCM